MLPDRSLKLSLIFMVCSVIVNSSYAHTQQPNPTGSDTWKVGLPIKNISKSKDVNVLFGTTTAIDKDQALTDAIIYNPTTKEATTKIECYELRNNNWVLTAEQQIPLKSEGSTLDSQNISLAMSGDKAVVATNQGLFSLNRSNGTWITWADILDENAIAYSVALNGNHLLAAETIKDPKFESKTILRAYEYVNGQWFDLGLDQKFISRISSISIENNMAIVGIPNAKDSNKDAVGAVKLFKFDGSQWHKSKTLHAGTYENSFGKKVALHDNSLFISFVDKGSTAGGLHIFDFKGNKIESTQVIGSETNSVNFASSFAVSDNHLLIGDAGKSVTPNIDQGVIYSYQLSSFDGTKHWKWEQTIQNSSASSYQKLGLNIALSGNHALAGINTSNANGDASLMTLYRN